MTQTLPHFDTPQLALAVEGLTAEEINELPFGCIRLKIDGTVAYYSRRESELSGRGDRPILGLDFFTTIAPCMNNPAFKNRIDKAVAQGSLDIEFMHVGDFADRERELHVRAQSASGGGFWLFLQRE
jgi:photoactive yellow protein